MRTGRAPRHRGVENWSKVVDSFTGTVDTLCTNAMKELKLFINSEIAGPGGPALPRLEPSAFTCHPQTLWCMLFPSLTFWVNFL